MIQFWKKVEAVLAAGQSLVVMIVVESAGSSPGRPGFKMLVSEDGQLEGSIGGGIMEYKLVELCKQVLKGATKRPFRKRQIHQDGIGEDRSGLICSGEQTVAFYWLDQKDRSVVSQIVEAIERGIFGVLRADEEGLQFQQKATLPNRYEYVASQPEHWQFKEDVGQFPQLSIVGSGHVGLALAQLARQVGFEVRMFDDREGLNLQPFQEEIQHTWMTDYADIGNYVEPGNQAFVVIISFGYRTDKIILRELIGGDFKYLGMMGSKKKVARLMEELEAEGIPKLQLDRVHAPIGIPIASKTPAEIAISILGELILVKNS